MPKLNDVNINVNVNMASVAAFNKALDNLVRKGNRKDV